MDPARHDAPLQLVFSGECIDGHDPQAVRDAVASALKLDQKRAAHLFSGKPVVLRRQVDAAAAHRHIARFATLGALLHAEPAQPLPRRREPGPANAAPARAARTRRWRRLRRGSRRLLRWASIGVLCIFFGVMLGLVLGPGLNSLWPDESPPAGAVASASDKAPDAAPVAPAAVDVSPAKPPPGEATTHPATVDEIPKGMTAEAVREYRQSYLPAPNHKAFAISSKGTHAWIAGAPSENDAREGAVANCIRAMQSGDDGCRIVDADGDWVD